MKRYPVYKAYFRALKLAINRRVLRRKTFQRENRSADEYGKVWAKPDNAKRLYGNKTRPQTLNGRMIYCRAIDHRKFFLNYLRDTAAQFQPERVVELGSGNGINLIALAVMNPGIKTLRGVDIAESGVTASYEFLKHPPIEELTYLTGEPGEVIRSRLAGRDIQFVKGDMRKLPFGNKSFDFVFSCWAFEQIPHDYLEAFREAERVGEGHALFLEAFWEAQGSIFQKLHLIGMDYFHASFWEVQKAGFNVVKFEPMTLTKIKFVSGALLCSTEGSS